MVIFGCIGSLLLHVGFSLVEMHRLSCSVAYDTGS